MASSGRVLVVGEVLVDVVHGRDGRVEEHVGGSPANVALGLARLGHPVDLACVVGDDEHGRRCVEHLRGGGVRITAGSLGSGPTSTALATLDERGAATYDFDLHWDLAPVTPAADTVHVHTGSIGATLRPGEAEVTRLLTEARGSMTVSYDPNVRPSIMGPPAPTRARVEEIVALADVVKCSSDDLEWMYAGTPPASVMADWLALGAGLVVVTLGAGGVSWRVRGEDAVQSAPARAESVADTVGAGDSFMAGLVSGLVDAGLLGGPEACARLATASPDDVEAAVERALATSAITVAHAGAYAPTRAEIGAPASVP